MQNSTATLTCPHPSCQTPNPEGNKFCLKCGSFLPRNYLWLLASGELGSVIPGTLLGDRYLLKTDRIVLDTRPGLAPETPEEIPPYIAPYLKLFAHRIHVPQVYGRVPPSEDAATSDLWLLESVPIEVDGDKACLFPAFTESWRDASPLRQLNWLWQMASLWSPFARVGVASSLFDPQWLRVEGGILRLAQLRADTETPTLQNLGRVWSKWVEGTAVPMRDFLHRLCQLLIEGRVRKSEQLIALLDRGLTVVGEAGSRQVEIFTLSDRGPSRTRNEDACYPDSGTTEDALPEALAIVCDGVGGHEGGDVASGIAIETIARNLQPCLNTQDRLSVAALTSALETSIYKANDAISAQNNHEQRQGRQRMGTTVAIGLTHAHEFYITHVGDSRAYRITPKGCHQLTLDDDVASREVRLGYALYRNALQQVAAGSLVQAIGMGSSNTLYPNINRTILDEDCLFLLCSDGLSDYDRVEQYWEDELLPALAGQIALAEAAGKLVSIANTLNGHDNVTVALIRVRVTPPYPKSIEPSLLLDCLDSLPSNSPLSQARPPKVSAAATADVDETEELPTRLVVPPSPPRSTSLLPAAIALLSLGLALSAAGYFAYRNQPDLKKWVDGRLGRETAVSPTPTAAPPAEAILALDRQVPIRLLAGTQLWKAPGEQTKGFEEVPAETLLQVVNRQEIDGEFWLEMQVCQRPQTDATLAEKGTDNSEKTEPSVDANANSNEPQAAPQPAESTDRETSSPAADPSSDAATPSASPAPPSNEKPKESAGETPSPDPDNTSSPPPEAKEKPPSATFWIVDAELGRVGFETIEAESTDSKACQSRSASIPSEEVEK